MTQSNTNKVVDFLKRFETGSSSKQTGGTFSRHYSRGGGSRYQQSGAGSLGASQESPLIVQFAERSFKEKMKGTAEHTFDWRSDIYCLQYNT